MKKNRETAKATAYSGRNPGKGENNAIFNFLPRFVLNTWYPTFNYQKWEGVSTGSRVRASKSLIIHQGMHAWIGANVKWHATYRISPDKSFWIYACTTILQPSIFGVGVLVQSTAGNFGNFESVLIPFLLVHTSSYFTIYALWCLIFLVRLYGDNLD